jgi:hypothetical protein
VCTDRTGRGRLCLPLGLIVSFQRFACPGTGVVDRAPASLGALPIGRNAARELLLPLERNECFWIGLSVTPGTAPVALAVAVEQRGGRVLDAISGADWDANRPSTVTVPETLRVTGIRRPDGRLGVFARELADSTGHLCVRLRLRLRFRVARATAGGGAGPVSPVDGEAREAALRLVDYRTFATDTALAPPGPLNLDAGYKGWLLP